MSINNSKITIARIFTYTAIVILAIVNFGLHLHNSVEDRPTTKPIPIVARGSEIDIDKLKSELLEELRDELLVGNSAISGPNYFRISSRSVKLRGTRDFLIGDGTASTSGNASVSFSVDSVLQTIRFGGYASCNLDTSSTGELVCGVDAGESGSNSNIAFVTIGNTASLSLERALTGTANQITVTDGGANSTVTLSIPADGLDFTQFSDTMTLDNTTSIASGGFKFSINADTTFDNKLTAQTLTLAPHPEQIITAVTDTITASNSFLQISADADYELTSTPSIASGSAGQVLILHNTGNFVIELQENADLGGSSIFGAIGDIDINPQDTVGFIYHAGTSDPGWHLMFHQNVLVTEGDTFVPVRNVSGSTITAGMAVYATGWNNGLNVVTIDLADASDPAKMPAIGITNASILNNRNGVAITSGEVLSLDTSSFSVGDILYVSTTAGELTSPRPNTDIVQGVAEVLRSHASQGVILVQSQGDIPNDLLVNANQVRIGVGKLPSTIFEVGGTSSATYGMFQTMQVFSSDNSSTSYSRFGIGTTGHSLTASDDLLITGLAEFDDQVFMDAVGTALTVGNDALISGTLTVSTEFLFATTSNPFDEEIVIDGTSGDTIMGWANNGTYYWMGISSEGDNDFTIGTGLAASSNEIFIITQSGNVGIKTQNPTTEFQVNGSASVSGNFEIGNTTNGGGSVNIKAISGDNVLRMEETSGTEYFDIRVDSNGNLEFWTDGGSQVMGIEDSGEDVLIANRLEHLGDSNTALEFTSDRLRFTVGGNQFLDITESGSDTAVYGSYEIDFGGVTSFEIVNGTSLTIDADGKLGYNTASDSLELFNGSGTTSLNANCTIQKDYNLFDPDTQKIYPLQFHLFEPFTVFSVFTKSSPSTSAVDWNLTDGTNELFSVDKSAPLPNKEVSNDV